MHKNKSTRKMARHILGNIIHIAYLLTCVENIYVIKLSLRFDLSFKTSYQHIKVSKCAKNRDRYNQVPHLTQDTNGKVTNSQLDTTNESQEVSPFPAGDHTAHINRRAQRHSKHKTEQKHKRSTKEVLLGTVIKIFHWRA